MIERVRSSGVVDMFAVHSAAAFRSHLKRAKQYYVALAAAKGEANGSRKIRRERKALRTAVFMSELKFRPLNGVAVLMAVAGIGRDESFLVVWRKTKGDSSSLRLLGMTTKG
jgi:hypothetical protein